MSIFTSFLSFIGCGKTEEEKYLEKHQVFFYKTKEFNDFENNTIIKLEEAFKIQTKFAKQNKEEHKRYMYFTIDGFYVFSLFRYNKTPVASTGGIWVDSKTGQVKYVKEEVLLKAYSFYKDK